MLSTGGLINRQCLPPSNQRQILSTHDWTQVHLQMVFILRLAPLARGFVQVASKEYRDETARDLAGGIG